MSDAPKAVHVIFRVGGEAFGLPVSVVNSIIRYEQPTPVPHSNQGILGVINLRGRVIPVIDVPHRLRGSALTPCATTRIVVASGSRGQVGLAVDSANEVIEFDAEAVSPVPEGVVFAGAERSMTGVIERNGELVVLLDLNEVVPVDATVTEGGQTEEGEPDV